jgi:acyl-CoA reductase-like NAD-dependent aldehyde dehydrogenase
VIAINPSGDACNADNRVIPPTIVTGVRTGMSIAQEEIFGPVLPLVDYETVDEAIGYANARPHPLAFYYFDSDTERVKNVVGRVKSGGVTVNDCIFHVGQPALPFGGFGASGIGRYHGFDGFETFSHKKALFWQSRWSALSLLRPPYDATKKKVLSFLLRD